jgi:2',3'-cyclic-nucleotide 2'-phosphodiesterase (5'-nucleotidase family)
MIYLKPVSTILALALWTSSCLASDVFTLRQPLSAASDLTCREETALGDFMADGLRKGTGADVGLLACGDVTGNRDFPAGSTFSPAELAQVISGERQTVVVELTGEQLLAVVEHAVSAMPASSPAFLQVSGLRAKIDVTQPAGMRVSKLTVQGNALELARSYQIAVTDTLLAGGNGHDVFKTAKRSARPATPSVGDMGALLQKQGVKDIKNLGRLAVLR